MIVEETIQIERPPEVVFAALVDLETRPDWDTALRKARKLTGGPIEFGTRFEATIDFGGKEVDLEYEVLDHQPYYTATLLGTGQSVTSQDRFVVRPEGDTASTVTLTAEKIAKGVAKVRTPVGTRWMTRQAKQALEELKRRLESA